MLGKAVPVLLAVLGLGGGTAAGLFLRPADTAAEGHAAEASDADSSAEAEGETAHEAGSEETQLPEYVKMNNQFVVPVVSEGRVTAMVVLSLSLEVAAGSTEAVYAREPRLRDAFLQVLFDHANVGGFSGSFTDGSNLVSLRTGLREAAAMIMGDTIKDVLITDIARQDG
ncbi:MAG: flagellar basal body-associated FliL family protein [Tabrizicola sp.]|uniref:flagellar basal body-associated FliL family protein n=1 Tax=Tabrizicola sp. TaxID=2005166 RepID=UPI00273692AE|nr:flagellar basal body-associated FliL family protein [Tabrizicola sp.]MDP3262486.1 flagellar basal body-associated FliL family protein [Tabrizicola sp.]MDP3648494.1 flagellar basal body-associated FliL family protein [Paracoccaceae bacterium]MDZ4066021.1 flagellar basal body-associated FliL family protein [Tabrizicola sp.]